MDIKKIDEKIKELKGKASELRLKKDIMDKQTYVKNMIEILSELAEIEKEIKQEEK